MGDTAWRGPLCPVTVDGRHKRLLWAGEGRSGLVCVACHKTWEFVDKRLVETYALLAKRAHLKDQTNAG